MAYTIKVISKDVSIQDVRLFVDFTVQLMDGVSVVAGPYIAHAEANRSNPDIRAEIKTQLKGQIKAWKQKLALENIAKQSLSTLETEIEAEV